MCFYATCWTVARLLWTQSTNYFEFLSNGKLLHRCNWKSGLSVIYLQWCNRWYMDQTQNRWQYGNSDSATCCLCRLSQLWIENRLSRSVAWFWVLVPPFLFLIRTSCLFVVFFFPIILYCRNVHCYRPMTKTLRYNQSISFLLNLGLAFRSIHMNSDCFFLKRFGLEIDSSLSRSRVCPKCRASRLFSFFWFLWGLFFLIFNWVLWFLKFWIRDFSIKKFRKKKKFQNIII